jgi:hypothetical protein
VRAHLLPLLLALGIAPMLIACSKNVRAHPTPSALNTDRATTEALAPDTLPACFQQSEPATAPTGDRQESMAALRPGATPPPGRETQLRTLVAMAPFSLYALAAPPAEYAPLALQDETANAGTGRALVSFTLRYRAPARAGGAIAIVTSRHAGGASRQTDLDDSLDAVQLAAALHGKNSADALADPPSALGALGCPQHNTVTVNVPGSAGSADLLSWPGVANVLRLRFTAGETEVTLFTAGLTQDAAIALAGRLQPLQRDAALVQQLRPVFVSPPPTPTPRRALAP